MIDMIIKELNECKCDNDVIKVLNKYIDKYNKMYPSLHYKTLEQKLLEIILKIWELEEKISQLK